MATPQALFGDVASGVEALVSGAVRLASDLRDDLEAIPAGATRYQLNGGVSGVAAEDSNQLYTSAAVALFIHHHLDVAAGEVERDWTFGAGLLQTYLEALSRGSWWRALASCHDVVPDSLSYTTAREGSVVTTALEIELTITP